jgi:hypothetical protein
MRKHWFLPGILTGALVFGSASLAPAQTTSSSGGSSSGGIGSSSSIGSSSGIGSATTSGSTGSGIATLGATGNKGKSTSSTTNVIPAASDPFITTYSSPYALGLSGVSTSFSSSSGSSSSVTGTGFGKPAYAVTTTTTQGTANSSTTINSEGWSTLNIPKTPPYMTVLSDNIPIVSHAPSQLQGVLLNTLDQATFLKDKKGIFLAVDGSTVLLKGQVANERERRVVEGFVRMTPGVRNVVNELIPLAVSPKQ